MAEAKGADGQGNDLRTCTMTSPARHPRRESVHLGDLSGKLAPFGMEHIAGNVDKWCSHLLDIGPKVLALDLVMTAEPADLALKVRVRGLIGHKSCVSIERLHLVSH